MEVSGRRKDTKNVNTLCADCNKDDKPIEAFGYCWNCNIHLCESCEYAHKTASHLRCFALPETPYFATRSRDPLPACSEHKNETIKFYCRPHDETGCMACMLSHERCDTVYIPDISQQFLKSEDLFQFKVYIEELKTRLVESMKHTTENLSDIRKAYRQTLQDVRDIKRKIIDSLENFEKELQDKAMSFKTVNENELKKIESDLDIIRKSTLKTETLVDRLEKENKLNALFLEVKRGEKCLFDYHERLYEISTGNKVQVMRFLPSKDLESLMCIEKLFGIIQITDKEVCQLNNLETVDTHNFETVNIHSKDDKKSCFATGLSFLSNDYLAVADKINQKVKVVDVRRDKIMSEITLQSGPKDLTTIPPDKIAVTLTEEEYIQILTTQGGLVATEKIKTNGKCLGVKFNDGKLIVTYGNQTKPRIEILNLYGEVLCKFNLSDSSIASVTDLAAIALSSDNRQMYITGINKTILRLSKSGAVTGSNCQHKYTGVAVSIGGSVYASSKKENKIVQLSDDLSTSETVLTRTQGILKPLTLAYNKVRNKLYVSCGGSNRILVFQIKLESYDAVLYVRQK